jgi:hypothetical protein
LHKGGDLSLQVGGYGDPARYQCHDQPDLNKRPDNVVDCVSAEKLQQQIIYEIDWGKKKHSLLAINFTKNNIQRANNRDYVSDQMTQAKFF